MEMRSLFERDICTKLITPALRTTGWDEMLQISEEVSFTTGPVIVHGKLVTRGKAKRADYILYYKPNIPIAEAKDNTNTACTACNITASSEPASRMARLTGPGTSVTSFTRCQMMRRNSSRAS